MITQTPAESLLALVASVFDAYTVVLFQADEEGKAAHMVASFSMSDQLADNALIPPGKGLVGWILRNKSPLLVDSIEENQAYLGYYREGKEPEIHSFMGCPIPGGGALCIDSKRHQAFAGSRQKLLHLFALMIPQLQSVSSHSTREAEVSAYFSALERLGELRTSYTGWNSYLAQFLELLSKSTGFSYAAFASRVEGSPNYIVEGESPALLNHQDEQVELPVNTGIVGWVLRNGEAVLNQGGESNAITPVFGKHPLVPDFAASMCLPVIVDKYVCGVLCLADMEVRVFTDDLRAFVRMAAEDIARLLEVISLRYRVHSLMPKAALQRNGGLAFDPDSPASSPKPNCDE